MPLSFTLPRPVPPDPQPLSLESLVYRLRDGAGGGYASMHHFAAEVRAMVSGRLRMLGPEDAARALR